MHLLVLSAFRHGNDTLRIKGLLSQCTFWCSVLSDSICKARNTIPYLSLNAPFGAQCFPTSKGCVSARIVYDVSMHLLVLSAFRLESSTMLSNDFVVSMHLLVLSAFRRILIVFLTSAIIGLNAPFGAQCFPTSLGLSAFWEVLSSQCTFWCSVLSDTGPCDPSSAKKTVSMHLLVLSAFRQRVL